MSITCSSVGSIVNDDVLVAIPYLSIMISEHTSYITRLELGQVWYRADTFDYRTLPRVGKQPAWITR
jgi:hypothetical protein